MIDAGASVERACTVSPLDTRVLVVRFDTHNDAVEVHVVADLAAQRQAVDTSVIELAPAIARANAGIKSVPVKTASVSHWLVGCDLES